MDFAELYCKTGGHQHISENHYLINFPERLNNQFHFMKENGRIFSQSSKNEENTRQHPGLNCGQAFRLGCVGGDVVEDVDQHQEESHEQGHPTCQEDTIVIVVLGMAGLVINVAVVDTGQGYRHRLVLPPPPLLLGRRKQEYGLEQLTDLILRGDFSCRKEST